MVSQAAIYVKRNKNIGGLNQATTWLYDTEQVDAVNVDLDLNFPDEGLRFEGAQLVDSENLCLTRGADPIFNDFDDRD